MLYAIYNRIDKIVCVHCHPLSTFRFDKRHCEDLEAGRVY